MNIIQCGSSKSAQLGVRDSPYFIKGDLIMGNLIGAFILLVAGIIFSVLFKKQSDDEMKKATGLKDLAEKETSSYEKKDLLGKANKRLDKAKSNRLYSKIALIAGIACSILILITSMIAMVPTGHTGIKTTFGKVENETLPSGINFILPWQKVINMDNREQRSSFALEAFSKDIQQVDITGSVNLNIDKNTAMNLYKDVGIEYPTILVGPRVQEDVKIIIAEYTAEMLIENRQNASDKIYALLKQELAEKGINVISFAIENIDFTDAFESAVEAKQVATQEKQKAQTEQERQTMEMQQKAERDRIQAQAAADVQKIEADAKAYAIKIQADAEAEANQKIAQTLTDSLVKYNTVNQWDGKLPTTMLGNETNLLMDITGDSNEQ